ncbi:threonylcarbamoyl-AMP synthase [Limnohabitans sp. TS-CS-82]|uniref:L-threonylcarbamoyladenylate synthase n=1 Tax=Limnohabitans sp. TS-CS-82 TaxID=2094193 RepID=UPI000CF2B15F|nr:L-threonylcarbamoyladenylate synthase [Limnohabitans sp. TS-CS-82]PQA81030.1 threonylcarbamoyl-AMP synthase [Limnohabitans sp. TS-CS-82]
MILDGQSPQSITAAAQALQRGELLGLPTETVYGLAADAGNDAAVAKIFEAKGRPANHPLIVHVASAQGVQRFASHVPDFAQKLIDAFWPGPLTLILPRRPEVAAVAAGGQNSVGLRCPSHPTAHAVLQSAETLGVFGVAAPSANLFGRVSPTTAAHVAGEFGDSLLIIDGGSCDVGIESTIVDCTRAAPVLLRPGVLTPQQLSEACGETVITPTAPDADAPRASGTLESHYAPMARVQLMSAVDLQKVIDAYVREPVSSNDNAHPTVAVWARSFVQVPATHVNQFACQAMPATAQDCAHQLFAQLRSFDTQGVAYIWVETPPLSPEWDGVRDRLMRAATPTR